MPDDDEERKWFISKVEKKRKKALSYSYMSSRFYLKDNSFRSQVKKIVHNIFFKNKQKELILYKKYELMEERFNQNNTTFVAKLFAFPFKERRIWRREWFSGTIQLKFEMLTIPVPSGYLELLDKFYGNWRVFVKGNSTHGGVLFDVDKSYTEYLK